MSKQTAIKLYVEVGPDHTIRLPDEVPLGRAKVIVIIDQESDTENTADKGLVGLFADDIDVVDEAMAYVRERRQGWRIRPVA